MYETVLMQLPSPSPNIGGFLSHGGTPKSIIHFERWDFPQQKPSSYWGTLILGNPHLRPLRRGRRGGGGCFTTPNMVVRGGNLTVQLAEAWTVQCGALQLEVGLGYCPHIP